MDSPDLTSRGYGAVLWEPDQQTVHDARITRFMRWLAGRGHDFGGYADLWQWSVTEPASFWAAVWDYFEVLGHRGPGHRDRHVHDHPLVERGHELARQRFHHLVGRQGDEQHGRGTDYDA